MEEVTDKSIKDTGERMVPVYHKSHMVYGEHIVRYQAATTLVKNKVVLDVASGSGYGSALMGEAAKMVYGVDVDKDAIDYSKKNYASKTVKFLLGSGTNIPLADSSVDIVVSFETIEHVEDYETFMKEIRRVLKEDGLLILSTPNDTEFPESNHFHIHEFERKELQEFVGKYFKHIKSYYQGTWLYNALLSEDQLTKEWQAPIQTIQTSPIKLDRCIYFYMLCSNAPIEGGVSSIAAISEHWSERNRQEYEASIRKHIEEQAAIINQKDARINELDTMIKDIERSTVFKIAKKARMLKFKI